MSDERVAALIKALTKTGLTATRLADEESPCVVHSFVSTGCTVLDAIMAGSITDDDEIVEGGLPCGRVVEIYGDTSTGKSLIAEQACAAIQQAGGIAVFIDTETSVSLPIMRAVGVDTEALIYLAPDTVEEVFQAMHTAVDAKQPDEPMLIVWDSVAATSAKAEMDKTTGETGYLTHARVISQGLRKLTRAISKHQVSCLFLNQAKQNIGVMFGDTVTTFGGSAIGFHSSIRIQLKVGAKIKAGDKKSSRVIGIQVRARIVKNKIAPPFREAVLPIYFGYGIDDDEAMLLCLKDAGLIAWSGGYYRMSENLGIPKFKRDGWADVLQEHWDDLWALVYEAVCQGDLI